MKIHDPTSNFRLDISDIRSIFQPGEKPPDAVTNSIDGCIFPDFDEEPLTLIMKTALLIAAAVAAIIVPAGAITRDDITPKKLFGKTLVFKIKDSSPPFADKGVWNGKFQSVPTDGFKISKVSGNTPSATTTRTRLPVTTHESYSLEWIMPGAGTAILSLGTLPDGTGSYEFRLANDETAFQRGTFTISPAPADAPDIAVQQPKGTSLTSGVSKKSFGSLKVGQTSLVTTFTIKNTGTQKLTGIAVTKSGANSGEFTVTGAGAASLAPGKTTTFTVKFNPKSVGAKSASLKIKSSDIDETPFVVTLAGQGLK